MKSVILEVLPTVCLMIYWYLFPTCTCISHGKYWFALDCAFICCLKPFLQIVKQTVMTSVYGVTAYGARAQIRGKLEDIDEFPQDLKYKASAYIAHKVFESLHGMFSSAKEIQVDTIHNSVVKIIQELLWVNISSRFH